MKRIKIIRLFLLGCLAVSGCLVQAQTMTDVFSKIPDYLILSVDSVKRLDMMDLYKNNKTALIKNNFNDTCILKSFSEDFLILQCGISEWEIMLLPMINDSKIICTIQTICAPVCDSQIRFYTTEWKKLDSDVFISVADKSWFFKNDTDISNPTIMNESLVLDIDLMEFHYDQDKFELTQTYTTPFYLSLDDREKMATFLKEEPKVFKWKQTRFE